MGTEVATTDFHLTGRRAVVTGASRGIGRAIAAGLLRSGVSVLMCGRTEAVVQTAATLSAQASGTARALPFRCDLATAEGISDLLNAIRSELEVPDYLVNCAGNEPFGSLDDFDETKWRQAFDLKLWGYVKLSHGVFELMRQAHREGCIINVAGSGGAFPQAWYPAGAMINAAVSAFTVAFAHQAAAFGVRVNAVSPHYIATERLEGGFADPTAPGVPTLREMRASVGMRRMGRTTEVADAVLYLLSPGAAFVSGAVLPVDGATVGLLAANDYDWNAAKGGHDARADR